MRATTVPTLERAVHGEHAAPAVDERGGERRREQQRDEEEARVDGLRDADVAHAAGLVR